MGIGLLAAESIGSKLSDGGFMLLLGLVVVFFGMALIIFFVTIIGLILKHIIKDKPDVKQTNEVATISDEEKAAIVASLKAYYEANNIKKDVVIKSITRV